MCVQKKMVNDLEGQEELYMDIHLKTQTNS